MRALPPLFALLVYLLLPTGLRAAEPPNFVLIFIDDMGYGDIGPFGSTQNPTPHLDRLADEGMKLTSFYAAPVCSASRAQLLTGCYAPRVSVPGVFFPAGHKGLHPQEETIADYLKGFGYATSCVGKWHLGDQPEFLPTRQGFDHYFGIPYSNDMGRKSAVDGRVVHPLMRDEEVARLIEQEDQRQVTRQYTEEATRFLEANQDRPFFLYMPHTAVHVPIKPHPDFVGASDNGRYGDWVAEVDWSVGQIMATLQRLSLAKNTCVLFTSDNGPWVSKGKDGGVATPLRGSKGGTLEGGVREPTIAWWPGKIPANTARDGIAGTADILPTFVSLAGGTLRSDVPIDGYDLSPLLLGNTDDSPRSVWHYYRGTQLKAVRSGPWKLALAPQSLGMGIGKQPDDLQSSGRLYHLSEDLGETTDVASKHPEVVDRLQAIAATMAADIGDGRPGPGVRPAGHVDNPVTLYPTVARNRRSSPPAEPIVWSKVQMGDVYATRAAPQLAQHPFTIRLAIKSKNEQPEEGMLVAHGGSAVGYAIYLQKGKMVFAVRTGDDRITRVSAPWEPTTKPLEARLTADALELSLPGKSTVSAPAAGTIPKPPQEDFCIGGDDRHPVDPQAPAAPFAGELLSLEIATQ